MVRDRRADVEVGEDGGVDGEWASIVHLYSTELSARVNDRAPK